MLDCIAYWHFSDEAKVGIGQTKLPGNRQRVVSSPKMEFADRTNVISAFNIDRDVEVLAFWTPVESEDLEINFAGAVSSGEGRNVPTFSASGLSYTGRVEFLPLGKFSESINYVEGDQFREPKAKLSSEDDATVSNAVFVGINLFIALR